MDLPEIKKKEQQPVEEKLDEQMIKEPVIEEQVEDLVEDLVTEPMVDIVDIKERKRQFYYGLKNDDSETARQYLGDRLIPTDKLLTYCLIENFPRTIVILLNEFPELKADIDYNLERQLVYMCIKYQRFRLLQEFYHKFKWSREDLNRTNKNAKGILEFNLLNFALYYQHLPTIEFLLRMGANPEISYPMNGNTTYHLAIIIGNLTIMETLLQYVQDVNVINLKKNTPLHLASQLGKVDFIGLLIDFGADLNKRNYDTHTPLDIAELENHTEVCQYLKQYKTHSNFSQVFML